MNLVKSISTNPRGPLVIQTLICTPAEAAAFEKFLGFMAGKIDFCEEVNAGDEIRALWQKLDDIQIEVREPGEEDYYGARGYEQFNYITG